MKAAILNQYNKKDVNLSFSNLPTPGITADQVLVKSLAAGVNPVDNMITKGEVKLIIPLPAANRGW
jgi:NADPH:quinone reductase-like Zn-dependent oxidoreductase